MLSRSNIKTDGDNLLYNIISNRSGRDLGYDIKQVSQGCKRTVAFTNVNVIAAVSFMATLSIDASQNDLPKLSYALKVTLCSFFVHDMNWSDYVKSLWDLQSALSLSKEFCDDVLTHIEHNAADILDVIDRIPGDIGSMWLKIVQSVDG